MSHCRAVVPPLPYCPRCDSLEIKALIPEQRERLIEWIVTKFYTDRADVEEQLDSVGFPIRESDVVVPFFNERVFVKFYPNPVG